MNLFQMRHFALGATLATTICSARLADAAAISRLWTASGNNASWTSSGSWGGTEPGAGEIAQFVTNPSTSPYTVGINGGSAPPVGAVEVGSARSNALIISNRDTSGTTSATLTLNGVLVNTTVGGVDTPNVILHHAGTGNLTIQNQDPTRTLTVNLPNNPVGGNVIALDSTGFIIINSNITGAGGINFRRNSGTARFDLGGNNSYAGDTILTSGRIRTLAATTNAIPNGTGKGNLILNGGTQFGISNNETVNGLSGSGVIDNDANAAVTFTVGDNDATGAFNTFGGAIVNSGGNVNSVLSLEKVGAGVLTLTGANTYSGATTVTAGTLLVNGSHIGVHSNSGVAPADDYTVGSAGTLGGIGTIEAAVNLSGTISPGSTFSLPGMLTMDELALSGSVTGLYDIDALGGSSDLVEVTDLLDLTGNADVTIDVSVLNGAFLNDGIYNLVGYGDIALPTGGSFTYSGPLNAMQTATIGLSSLDGAGFVYLQLQTVPEPGSLSLVMIGMIGVGRFLRKRK